MTSISKDDPPVILAKAKFGFEGKNNDELSFSKNDIITITQQLEEGWWEGTFEEHTGWFPSNYVTILNEKDKLMRSRSVPNANALVNSTNGHSHGITTELSSTSRVEFRASVLSEFLKSEEKHITSLQSTYNDVLVPIKDASILNVDDYGTLACNMEHVLELQSSLLELIKENIRLDAGQQRVGGIFLSRAGELKQLLLDYCWNHPKAVEVLHEKEAELVAFLTLVGKEMKELIMGLSEPFRHLDKYPVVLQELERSVQDAHPDRGDIQRACAVYKDIRALCEAARKQKETQLELLYTKQVEGWATFEQRGRILYVSTGTVCRGDDRVDRCIAIFCKLILILEITPELNSYKLVQKLPTNGLVVRKTEEGIVFSGTDSFSLHLSCSFDSDRWLDALSSADGVRVDEATVTSRPPTPQKFTVNNMNALSPVRTPEVTQMPVARRARVAKKASFGPSDLKFNHELEMILPEGIDDSFSNGSARKSADRTMVTGFAIRPAALHRVNSSVIESGKKGVKLRKEATVNDSEDTVLLRIVEGYCSGAVRALPSQDSRPPQLIVAEDEKILVEELVGDEIILQEKSLVDTVYALKDQLSLLRQDLSQMGKTLEREQKARRRLEDAVRRHDGHGLASPISPVN